MPSLHQAPLFLFPEKADTTIRKEMKLLEYKAWCRRIPVAPRMTVIYRVETPNKTSKRRYANAHEEF